MNELGMKIKHAKKRGEWAELKFMVAASERGFRVTKPWGETTQYDFVVEFGENPSQKPHPVAKGATRMGHPARRFVRVQVKSTGFKDRGGYSCSVRGSGGAYVGDPFDFVAVYVVPEDVWYIIPEEVIRGRRSVAVYPGLKKSKYGKYKGAWKLMK